MRVPHGMILRHAFCTVSQPLPLGLSPAARGVHSTPLSEVALGAALSDLSGRVTSPGSPRLDP